MASLLDDKPFMIELNGLHFGPSKKVVGFKIFVESKLSNLPYNVAKRSTEVGREFLMYFGFWDFLALDNVFMPN